MKRVSYFILMVILLSLFGTSCTLSLCTRPEYIVTRTDDIARGVCTEADCSLRQAVFASNVCAGEQTIRIPAGTYPLTQIGRLEENNATGDLDILDSVQIIGVGMPVIDGNASDRVFDIQAGAIVEMSGLVIQNGVIPEAFEGQGGGIRNMGTLTITGALIQHNTGSPLGTNGAGGLFNGEGATAHISHSAIVSNYSEEGAGGVANWGTMTIDNVTISGNDAFGIFTRAGRLEISYSTIVNNISEEIWIGVEPGTVVIGNSIISGYPESGSCFGSTPSNFTSNGFNVEFHRPDEDRICSFDQPSDLVGVDPQLLPLSSYDGVTLPFHELDPASPALDSADPANCSGTDQRGVARPVGTGCDRGAIEMTDMISLPDLPVATAPPEFEPPELIQFILVIQVPANCRQGPGVAYPVMNSALPGEQAQVLGKSADGTWWYSQVKNDKCWISNIAGTPSGDLGLLPIIPAPPAPLPTETKVPAEKEPVEQNPEPTAIITVEPDNDGDGYPFSNDCNDKNPKINPGAVETPDDKVDSNCNGDDDK